MSALGVRRERAALSSGCKSHPATALPRCGCVGGCVPSTKSGDARAGPIYAQRFPLVNPVQKILSRSTAMTQLFMDGPLVAPSRTEDSRAGAPGPACLVEPTPRQRGRSAGMFHKRSCRCSRPAMPVRRVAGGSSHVYRPRVAQLAGWARQIDKTRYQVFISLTDVDLKDARAAAFDAVNCCFEVQE
jgi:hypothetical protein